MSAGTRVAAQLRWASSPSLIEFLTLTGLWERWKNECPLFYSSPNAPKIGDVLGTWLLSILSEHKRYAHVTAIRCDGVNPDLLGMNRIVNEDALRRALKAIDPDLGTAWLDKHLRSSTRALLDAPWILDIGTTIKPLYGRQQGSVVSYNPHKPGRPSHAYHTYLMAGTRLMLGIDVKAGNEHSANHSLAGLLHLLDGNLALMGWESSRRVVLIRRALHGEIALQYTDDRQQMLGFVEMDPKAGKRIRGYEYAVLVTNLDYEVLTLGQLYRDRADAETASTS